MDLWIGSHGFFFLFGFLVHMELLVCMESRNIFFHHIDDRKDGITQSV